MKHVSHALNTPVDISYDRAGGQWPQAGLIVTILLDGISHPVVIDLYRPPKLQRSRKPPYSTTSIHGR